MKNAFDMAAGNGRILGTVSRETALDLDPKCIVWSLSCLWTLLYDSISSSAKQQCSLLLQACVWEGSSMRFGEPDGSKAVFRAVFPPLGQT